MQSRKFDLHFLVHSVSRSLRRTNGVSADKYWQPLNQVAWELSCLLRESGFVDALPKTILSVTVMMCFEEAYRFDPSESHMEGKKQFKVYVHFDASGYADSPPDEQRYWPTMGVALDALSHVAVYFKMPAMVISRLHKARSDLPTNLPWPALPPFDLADVEHFHREQTVPINAGAHGRIQIARELPAEEGLLWVMCGPVSALADASIDRLQGDLREFVAKAALGEWDGDSRSGSVSDISFRVKNMARSATALRDFLIERWPSLDFVIGDEYDPELFEGVR